MGANTIKVGACLNRGVDNNMKNEYIPVIIYHLLTFATINYEDKNITKR
jgi:hypothetical protein